MAMTKFAVTLVGTRPLLLHNAQLADPTNQWSQELARQITDCLEGKVELD